jgi:hypothetical protein
MMTQRVPAVQLLEGLGGVVDSFVCGPDGFVEAGSALLLQAGQRVIRYALSDLGRQENSAAAYAVLQRRRTSHLHGGTDERGRQ